MIARSRLSHSFYAIRTALIMSAIFFFLSGVATPVYTGPLLAISPLSLNNLTPKGKNAASQSIKVWNDGEGDMYFYLSTQENWLTFTPNQILLSTGPDDPKTITVNYANASLPPGIYHGIITITAQADNSPQNIEVKLTVGGANPGLMLLLE